MPNNSHQSEAACGPASDTTQILRSLRNKRILIVDDNPAIHSDFRKVLCAPSKASAIREAEAVLFGESQTLPAAEFELDSAHQGQEALEKVQQAHADGKPYAMAFVDVRMPPGWDGIETVWRIWQVYPELQVVICTAYSDYSWEKMTAKLGRTNNLVILKKPFDNVEVLQLAHALTRKWELNRRSRLKVEELTGMVAKRTTELEAANAELKREGEQRLDLERQLRHAQKMEAVGQLAAGVAHDFNNILTIIHGHATMLGLRLETEGPNAKSLGQIRISVERAANLVRQLLTFSRKRAMQFRNVELNDVIQSVSNLIRQSLGEQISLRLDCTPGLPGIFADRGMIEQILVNLTVNAHDAIAGEGQVTIRSSPVTVGTDHAAANPEARTGQFVCLSVSDNGSGIDAQTMEHLFEPFFTTKDVGKGTGLGLATVYGIVKEHQGWLEVQSTVGAGSTFQVFFPISTRVAPQPVVPETKRPAYSGTETILLAEDEQAVREMVTESLAMLGYTVIQAESGPAALEAWQRAQGRIDLLLTDIVMPGGMKGHDLAEQLRQSNPHLKILFTTGYSPGASGARGTLEEGVNFLPKPYPPDKLGELVRRCLDSPVTPAPTATSPAAN
jgi:two-component system, NtrC family, sensor kinase